MRPLIATLLAKQKTGIGVPYIRVYLVAKAGTPTYDYTTRLLYLQHREEPFGGDANVGLDNSDLLLASNMKGYKLTLGYGYVIGADNEYSNSAPLWVISHPQQSAEGKVITELVCIDSWQRLAQLTFPTGGTYNSPSTTDPTHKYTIFNLIRGVLETGLKFYNPLRQLDEDLAGAGYEVVLDSSDGIIDLATYQPPYEVGQNSSYRAFVVGLLSFTKCAAKFCDDGKLHIFYPDYAGDTEYGNATYPAYEYDSEHAFYDETAEPGLVIPNHVYFNSASYAGEAVDQPTIDAYGEVKVWYTDLNIASNAEAAQRAECELARIRADRNQGSLSVPPNCGQELYDYIKITDSRASKVVEGRVGGLTHLWLPEDQDRRYRLDIRLGGLLQALTTTSPNSLMSDIIDLGTAPQIIFPQDIGGSLGAAQIPKAIQGFQHDIVFTSVGQANISWAAGTIKFYDGTTQAILAGSYAIPDSLVRYIYFDLASATPNVLEVTDNYLSVLTIRTGVVCTTQKGSDATVKAVVIPSFGKTPLITADIIYLTGLLDKLPNGTYGKVLATAISAGVIKLSSVEQTAAYRTTSDTEKGIWNGMETAVWRGTSAPTDTTKLWLDTSVTPNIWKRWSGTAWIKATPQTVDEIADGATYKRTLATDISAGHIKLTYQTAVSGTWYWNTGVAISAIFGIRLWGGGVALKTYPTEADAAADTNCQCYVGTDGKIYAGGGAVWMDATGFHTAVDAGNVAVYKKGTYTGNGTVSRQIATGFKCRYVVIFGYESLVYRHYTCLSPTSGGAMRVGTGETPVWCIAIGLHVSDGFVVSTGVGGGANVNDVTYTYVAFG